ncbi:MAG: hypothetical protein R2751_11700 [Bacteroidales bacterium]
MKTNVLLFALFFGFLFPKSYGTEFVILNDTIDFPNETDNNGFYFFYYNPSMPVNWLSPVDYVHGQVYTRYEIISQASDEPMGLQFGIWQKLPPVTGTLYENMEPQRLLDGPGSVAENHSSPSSWWALEGGVDFTKMDQVWHFGINPWKVDPDFEQIRSEYPEVWASRFTYWFPLKVRVTVIAVSSVATFSGWDGYVKYPTPHYTVNYSSETTVQSVPSTDEYSYSASMSPAFSGTGQPLALQPGQTVYFRTKAKDHTPASDIQTVAVPARPAMPAFAVDFLQARTTAVVGTDVEYSQSSDMSGSVSGTGTALALEPGSTWYFRKKATASVFASLVQTQDVPARPATPAFAIDFELEQTDQAVGSDIEYAASSDMAAAASGTGNVLAVPPSTTLYFRKKATAASFASLIQTLVSPARPSAPVLTMDYVLEQTAEAVTADMEYAGVSGMTGAAAGTGSPLVLAPGTTTYFRYAATASGYASPISSLTVFRRPLVNSPESVTTTDNPFLVTLEFFQNASGFTAGDLAMENAEIKTFTLVSAGSLSSSFLLTLTPLNHDLITIQIPANALGQGNFASAAFALTYTGQFTGADEAGEIDGGLMVVPNPAVTHIRIGLPETVQGDGQILIWSLNGSLVHSEAWEGRENLDVDVTGFRKGLYLVEAIFPGYTATTKFTVQ